MLLKTKNKPNLIEQNLRNSEILIFTYIFRRTIKILNNFFFFITRIKISSNKRLHYLNSSPNVCFFSFFSFGMRVCILGYYL